MEDLKTFVKLPAELKQIKKVKIYVDYVKKELEYLTPAQRKEKKLDIMAYAASYAEMYFSSPKSGALKRKAVLEACNGIDDLHVLEEYLNVVLESGKVVKNTMFKRVYLSLIRHLKKALIVN